MVELIKPLVRATARPGADAEIGGFGGLFDLKRAGFNDPVLVAATDGVGTKVKIAIETGRHDTIGIDLVAMCVNDLVVQGAEPLFFLDYFATGKLDPEIGAEVVNGIAEGCRAGRLRADRRRDRRDAGHLSRRRLRPRRLRGRRGRARHAPAARRHRAGDVVLGLASSGVHSNGYSLVRKVVGQVGARPGTRRRRSSPTQTLGEAVLDADADLREILPRRDPRDQGGQGAGPHHRRRLSRQHSARAAEGPRRAHRPRARAVPPVFRWLATTGGVAEQEMLRTFNCGIGMIAVVERATRPTRSPAVLTREGESVVRLGEVVAAANGEPRVTLHRPPRPLTHDAAWPASASPS